MSDEIRTTERTDRAIDWQEMLDAQRLDHIRGMAMASITVFKDGGYKIWARRDAEIAAKCEEDVLVTIDLPVTLAQCPRDPPDPSMAEYDARTQANWKKVATHG